MISLPRDTGGLWQQNNKGDSFGSLNESFNIDLEANNGKVRTTRTKILKTGSGALDAFGPVAAILYYSNLIRVWSGTTSGDNEYDGGNSPFDSLSNDSTSVSVSFDDGDATVFNTQIYVTAEDDINKYNGTSATVVSNGGLVANTHHLLCTFNPDTDERLYVSNNHAQVRSVSTADALAVADAQYTFDSGMGADYQVTVLMSGENAVWIGYSSAGNNVGAGRSVMFEWDGVTANVANARYFIDAGRIMAGVMKDNIPYVVDSLGRLMVFNGGTFTEVARFPLNGGTFINTSTNLHQNAIHPRGMAVDGDEILICVSNLKDGSSGATTYYNDFPAGVWAYSPTHGLYHKYSPSYQAVADTGTTNMTDYGQFRTAYGGPIRVFNPTDPASTDGGRVMFAMSYFLSGSDNISSDIQYGLWTDDTPDNTQKAGWIVTPRIPSSQFRDNWEKAYVALSDLETSGDQVELKYKTSTTAATYADATWTDTQTLDTNTDLSDYEQGDEVTVVQGKGSGKVAHIAQITTGGGTRITLDDTFSGAASTCVIKVDKWRKLARISDKSTQGFTIGEKDHWIQLKVYMQWTSARELYGILIKNTPSIT